MNNLSIASTSIRQIDGLYSLNDLHRAAGGDKKHQAANFLRLDTTQALIAEISHSSDVRSAVKVVNGGDGRGTFVCKELVYAYGMWISAAFMLKVIRVFDAQQKTPALTYATPARYPDDVLQTVQDALRVSIKNAPLLPTCRLSASRITTLSADLILSLLDKGYTYKMVHKVFTDCGVSVKFDTFAAYLSEIRKAEKTNKAQSAAHREATGRSKTTKHFTATIRLGAPS